MEKRHTYKLKFEDFKYKISNSVALSHIKKNETEQSLFLKNMQTHIHSSYEVFIVTGGELEIATKDNTYFCRECVAMVPPNLPHYTISKNVDMINVFISGLDREKGVEEKLKKAIDNAKPTIISLNSDERFYTEKVYAAEANNHSGKDELFHILSLLFADIFTRLLHISTGNVVKDQFPYIEKIECFISKHINEKILLRDVAEELHLCEKQVGRIIKNEYGCTLSDLVIRNRIYSASMLLLHSELSVGEVAEMTGYNSISLFRRHFLRIFKTTPSEFRKNSAVEPPQQREI